MDLQDAGCRAKYITRERDGKVPPLSDMILASQRAVPVPRSLQRRRLA
jgi:hypothetical protein